MFTFFAMLRNGLHGLSNHLYNLLCSHVSGILILGLYEFNPKPTGVHFTVLNGHPISQQLLHPFCEHLIFFFCVCVYFLATFSERVELDTFHQPCILTPEKGNIHEVSAVFGPAAFLDILAPPYDDKAGRPCHYYRACSSLDGVSWDRDERSESPDWWLMEIPQPSTFWCGGQAYFGPCVTL
uniref:Uncharacterized protein n=1 Tax=Eptatretus burgeri TaxID=7764 RepID=A0A8C4Q9P4_EPTBU